MTLQKQARVDGDRRTYAESRHVRRTKQGVKKLYSSKNLPQLKYACLPFGPLNFTFFEALAELHLQELELPFNYC